MEEVMNLTAEQVAEIIKDFPLVPYGNRVIITLNREEVDGNLVLSNNTLDDEQYVIAVGPRAAHDTAPGDVVLLDLEKMTVRMPVEHDQYQTTSQIKVDPIEIDGVVYGFVNDNCFKAKYKM
jgi:hypothetical protein